MPRLVRLEGGAAVVTPGALPGSPRRGIPSWPARPERRPGTSWDPALHPAVLLVVLTAPAQELPPDLLPALLVALAAATVTATVTAAVGAGRLLRGGVD